MHAAPITLGTAEIFTSSTLNRLTLKFSMLIPTEQPTIIEDKKTPDGI